MTEHSSVITPQLHKQNHELQFVFKDAKDKMFELGWEINIIEDNFIRAKIIATDIYDIKNINENATDEQLIQVAYDTFRAAKDTYIENKTFLSLLAQIQCSPDDKMPQTLQELARILTDIQESSTHDNRSRQP